MKNYKFEISSLNSEKCINLIIQKYEIFDFSKNEGKVIFYCKNKDKKNIEKILKKLNQKIYKKNYFGFLFHIKNIFSIGIIIGIFLSLILWGISTFFITDILVIGNYNLTTKEIFEVLENNEIYKWKPKKDIDTKQLQNKIENINHISYASVIIRGNALIVNVKEELTNNEVINIGNFDPIVSVYDGQITSVKLIQGTLKVKVGDIIKVGDILVEPYITSMSGERVSVEPLADIVCDVYVTSRLNVKEKQIKVQRTGNVQTNYELSVFGLQLFKKYNDVIFKSYEKEEKEVYVSNVLLPIKRKETIYYETTVIEENINFEQNKQTFIEQCKQIALLNLTNYDIIKNESYSIYKIDDTYTISYTLTLNKKIC